MYETRILETAGNFCCEISYKPKRVEKPPVRRVRYQDMSNFFQALQAVVVVLSVL